MKVVITSATNFETVGIKPLLHPGFDVIFHKSGVGLLSSTFSLTKIVYDEQPDLLIQAGIAGCFNANITLGKVVVVKDEFLGDTGVEENGVFKDIFDLGLETKDGHPYFDKRLRNEGLSTLNLLRLQEVVSITINEVTTRPERIKQLQKKYVPVIESMEGAALHYVALQTKTPFIQIRAISNYIGERDKTKWKMKTALENLQNIVVKYMDELYKEFDQR